jgi:UDPglucose--hexose-1-phosphate uridylyltransferase
VDERDDRGGCPFCEGREAATPPESFALGPPGRAADAPGWWVRVVPNKFPAFGPWSDAADRGGLFARKAAVGRQEVVIHSPRHVRSFADLSARELSLVARAWRARVETAREAGFAYVHCSINEGRAAGASLSHSHSQLVWLPEAPPLVKQEREVERDACVVCSMIREEIAQRIRLVSERDGLVLLCPFASRQPYEMLVAPVECESDPYAPERLESALALVWDGARRLRGAEGPVSYNAWLHAEGHWHIEIVPRIAIFAGLELGAGYYVNTLAPESAAGVLREA